MRGGVVGEEDLDAMESSFIALQVGDRLKLFSTGSFLRESTNGMSKKKKLSELKMESEAILSPGVDVRQLSFHKRKPLPDCKQNHCL